MQQNVTCAAVQHQPRAQNRRKGADTPDTCTNRHWLAVINDLSPQPALGLSMTLHNHPVMKWELSCNVCFGRVFFLSVKCRTAWSRSRTRESMVILESQAYES